SNCYHFATQLDGTRRNGVVWQRDCECVFGPKILTKGDSIELAGMAEAEFRVRCFQPLSHLSVAAMTYVSFSALAKGFPRGGAVPERREGNRTATGEHNGQAEGKCAPEMIHFSPSTTGRYSRISPGWQSSAAQIRSSVSKRTPLTLPDFNSDTFCSLMPICSASSFERVLRRASMTSRLTMMGMRSPRRSAPDHRPSRPPP